METDDVWKASQHKPHPRVGLNPQRLRPELLSGIALHEQHTRPV